MTYPSNFTLPSEVLEAIAQEGIYRGFARINSDYRNHLTLS